MSLPVLASELTHRTIWYPTILGILVVVFGILLFVGSIYLLLGTNVGGRLALLITFTALSGFMLVLSSLWVTTASPLNTIKGRIPAWKVVEIVDDPSQAQAPEVRAIVDAGRKVDTIEAANVKAAVDENLVQIQALPSVPDKIEQKFARFQFATDYKILATYETGGSKPNPLDFEATHTPLFAVAKFCEVTKPVVVFGTVPPEPTCMASSDLSGFIVLERDLGSLRVPPLVALVSSALLFALGLLALHWREKDEAAAKRRREESDDSPEKVDTPEPVNA